MERVSVIMPVRNEAASIESAVTSVLQQDWPPEALEICVVDGRSTDGTREKIMALARRDARVRLLDNPRCIIPAALNLGLRAARGPWIARLDGHGSWPPNYLRECTGWLERTSGLAVAGGAWDCVGHGWLGSAIARVVSSPLGIGNARYRTVPSQEPARAVDSVPFWVARREVFERVGLFREDFPCHEDYEFNYRLRRAGGQVWLLPWVRARYRVRPTLGRLARQYLRYGHWKGRFLATAPGSVQPRHVIPPLWVAISLVLAGAAAAGPGGRPMAAGWAALYGAYVAAASARLTCGRKPADWDLRSVAVLPVVLLLVHACWGLGVWSGLLRGPVRGAPPGWPGLSTEPARLETGSGATADSSSADRATCH
ncbi:MAG: glycosyltransferase family 2 protein [Limisphaera sp.]